MLANYTNEQQQFQTLIEGDTESRILLLKGESGTGKSFFIEHCLQAAADQPQALLKLQNGGDTIATMFNIMGRQLGWKHLPTFTNTLADLLDRDSDPTSPLWQVQIRRHLRQIGTISDLQTRQFRHQLLIDAWFTDALSFEIPFLLAIDTYEKASTEFSQWFCNEFLEGVAYGHNMRVLVGGQEVPQIADSWSFCASLQEIHGINEAKEWLVWAQSEGYQVPSLELLTGVVIALKGRPIEIVEIIKSQFPKASGPIGPKMSLTEQRALWRVSLSEGFNLDELFNITFDLGLNYHNLQHDTIPNFVRELMLYFDRRGRLPELIMVCQKARPHLEW